MTAADAKELMKSYYRLPLALYDRDPDVLDRAIQTALRRLTRLTGGNIVEGGTEIEGPAEWVAYGQQVLFYPDTPRDVPGATSVAAFKWTLDNIDEDHWLVDRFIEMAAELATIDVAGKLEIADGMQETPITFNFSQLGEDAANRLKELEDEIKENWITPLF